jgi:tRNA-splicing ligase RtcB (3'-phosphate/5'-hydroxy nucleic acid ligase)
MKWVKNIGNGSIPIKSWCENIEAGALEQAVNLARHPVTFSHVALMPDCHVGYGMPIGGVIACKNAVIPNAVGVDIGCGMVAVKTTCPAEKFVELKERRALLDTVKQLVPVGEGHSHQHEQDWDGFDRYFDALSGTESYDWPAKLDHENLGTLGGGNHFIELQVSEKSFTDPQDEGMIWLMIHSGSRNLGYKVASYYHKKAMAVNEKWHSAIPVKDLAFLPADSVLGQGYIRDMNFALDYALENRRRMMACFKQVLTDFVGEIEFLQEINIHHNYAALENHFGKNVWVHRKGATSAKAGELGIIPGSMGTSSYIVKGRGAVESFMSCSHGAGRKMGRADASRHLSVEDCDRAMTGIVFDRWSKFKSRRKKPGDKKLLDLSEAPLAYKDIETVIAAELDLIEPLVKLSPLGVVKG